MAALASTTAAIMVGAALLEALLPWPARFRPGATVPLLTRLGQKVYRPDGSPSQQRQAGLLALLVVWVPCAAGLWAVRNLSLSEPLFDLLFLLLMLESRPLRELALASRALATQETLLVARLQAASWLRRETGALSVMGLNKAVSETCVLRLVGQWASPLLGFALAGVQGALLWRLAQLMNQAWSPKQAEFVHFGRAASALYQGLCAPAILLLALPLALTRLRQLGGKLRLALRWPYPAMGGLLSLLAQSTGCRLGGPRYYQGQLVRLPVFDEGAEPDATLPRRLLHRLLLIGWGWLGLSLLLTLMTLRHG
ncbi:cobalamin biosynthesis protein CobD [Aeromonas rivipollensis]|uniref:Cobalamin biosynthesis protein CobD n=1 Tax=Aeromonas rivipollensis TaxID=948519 RepID=A0ABX0CTJ4_9GAMM|nr:cobalamin biosynthesis protein [Aeromonas rivipollensis]NEX87223.1 cobalamin biosynthesis protein CobD [Aeromonas rivipollensis]NEY04412.1 cobalamin biosynthesis protein CobD [Aeromonas rivipollensis]